MLFSMCAVVYRRQARSKHSNSFTAPPSVNVFCLFRLIRPIPNKTTPKRKTKKPNSVRCCFFICFIYYMYNMNNSYWITYAHAKWDYTKCVSFRFFPISHAIQSYVLHRLVHTTSSFLDNELPRKVVQYKVFSDLGPVNIISVIFVREGSSYTFVDSTKPISGMYIYDQRYIDCQSKHLFGSTMSTWCKISFKLGL